jgi:NADH-quinone oxidoreductase subunit N
MKEQLQHIFDSARWLLPEGIIAGSLLTVLFTGLFVIQNRFLVLKAVVLLTYLVALTLLVFSPAATELLFGGMLRTDLFSTFFKLLFLTGGLITVLISHEDEKKPTEYFLLIHATVLGACLLAMSLNFVMILLSLELISLSSYLLAGFGSGKKSAEGGLKYFLFGSVATACMIYGMSLLYGISGSLDFTSDGFLNAAIRSPSLLFVLGGLLALGGFLFKIAAVPFHLWAPDVYQSAPTPVVAFFSVVPKLAGFAILSKFALAMHAFGQSPLQWQLIISLIAILTILVGNLSALMQTNAKRMMAYSSVAQSGFLLIGLAGMHMEGIQFMLFYSVVYLIMNFLVFHTLQQFEKSIGENPIPAFAGLGKALLWPSLAMLIGLISLTGLPPTAGFTAKLLIFSSLFQSYEQSSNLLLLVLFIVGLVNTVVSLFYYLKIPYHLFMKGLKSERGTIKTGWGGNLLSLILVILLVYLFIQPHVLMSWINRITFVL